MSGADSLAPSTGQEPPPAEAFAEVARVLAAYDLIPEHPRALLGAGGTIHPVYLQCSIEELERRIANPDRVAQRKLRSVEGLRTERARWNWVAVPRPECLAIATDGKTPATCADEILARLSLPRPVASLRQRDAQR